MVSHYACDKEPSCQNKRENDTGVQDDGDGDGDDGDALPHWVVAKKKQPGAHLRRAELPRLEAPASQMARWPKQRSGNGLQPITIPITAL